MIGYLSSMSDLTDGYKAIKVNVISYNLPIECRFGETGQAEVIAADVTIDPYYLNFRIEDPRSEGITWIVTKYETSEQIMTLTLSEALGAIASEISFPEQVYANYPFGGAHLAYALETCFPQGDPSQTAAYTPHRNYSKFIPAQTYREPRSSSSDPLEQFLYATVPDSNVYKVVTHKNSIAVVQYDVRALLTNMNNVGLTAKFEVQDLYWNQGASLNKGLSGELLLSFTETTPAQIVFDDGHSELQSATFDDDVVSCVGLSWRYWGSSQYAGTRMIYYLSADGTLTQDRVDQVNGKAYYGDTNNSNWVTAYADAQAIIDQNKYSHKIEFWSDKKLKFNQPVRLKLPNEILNTTISKCEIRSDDDRYFYTCGDLPKTAAQHIKANSWSYGTRLPANPYKGQLVFI